VKQGIHGLIARLPGEEKETTTSSHGSPVGKLWRRLAAWATTPTGRVWLDAAQIWIFTRVVFLALTYLVPALLVKGADIGSPLAPLHNWATQDGAHYLFIAQDGYDAQWRTNFWPLFPLLGHILGPVFGGDDALALLAISNLAFFGTLLALRRLTERELGADTAYRAALYLAIFPTAFYFFAPYTESLFLCLAISSFSLMRERRWWLAGMLGFLAALTRSSGVLLLAPFAFEFFTAWRAGKARWYDGLAGLLVPAGVAAYSIYLMARFGSPLAFSQNDSASWRHNFSLPWKVPGQILIGVTYLGNERQITATHFLLNLAAVLAFIILLVAIWRMLPFSYTVYSLAILAYVFSFSAPEAAILPMCSPLAPQRPRQPSVVTGATSCSSSRRF
jgi:Gpi18-like mannosyltransferase